MTPTAETPTKKSFIKVTEVWIPNGSRTSLELSSGIYGDLEEFKESSRDESFVFDEGLPGKAWATGQPVVLTEFNDDNFKRTEAAHKAGLTCGVAIPVFAGEFVMGVVTFFCGEDGFHAGALEVWRSLRTFPFEIVLEDGYYGSLDDFAFISRKTRFRSGFGLPGLAIEQRLPVVLGDLANSGVFARSFDASRAEMTTALALPCLGGNQGDTVVCLLSSEHMPIAKRYEVWVPEDDDSECLRLHSALCSIDPDWEEMAEDIRVQKGLGVLGQTWLTGIPRTSESLEADLCPVATKAKEMGLRNMVTFPFMERGFLKAVVAWYF
ncbi:GAF domain-containing protein [Pelagicoccus albus]|uniref:GAF domain-containing protein n=1 Tax=Pelagicoccus albus TaxID=415222 RepID=A0A7X1B6M5_9BACT|nr:GAF domain-containing protein [Pelagicoccus albus]MBC2606626.1 GAF domain-containing protein [Pelagicoccus albus]